MSDHGGWPQFALSTQAGNGAVFIRAGVNRCEDVRERRSVAEGRGMQGPTTYASLFKEKKCQCQGSNET